MHSIQSIAVDFCRFTKFNERVARSELTNITIRFCYAVALFTAAAVAVAKPLPVEFDEISVSHLPVCYDFGCKTRATVALPVNHWNSVADWFSPPAATPAAEREQIKHAIGWMETVVGWHTPTHKDFAYDLPAKGDMEDIFPGQLDCIDEAINATTYLKLFARKGLLRHHEVIAAAYRRAWFDQHWAGQVREKVSGTRYVVDSWFQPNGFLPVMQNSIDWENITPLSAAIDTSERKSKPAP